jgi:8-oxo-dGTP diphosphatase
VKGVPRSYDILVSSTIRVLAAVIASADGRYLVGLRPRAKRHGNLWEFPGGKVELGESDAQALARELTEELGVTLQHLGAQRFVRQDPGSPYEIVFVDARINGTPTPLEHEALGWFTPAELAAMPLAPSDAAFVQQLGTRPNTP